MKREIKKGLELDLTSIKLDKIDVYIQHFTNMLQDTKLDKKSREIYEATLKKLEEMKNEKK